MSTISNQLQQGGYYSLAQSSGSSAQTARVSGSAARSSATSMTAPGADSAYMLDLSPQAREYLIGLQSKKTEPAVAESQGFTLNRKERLALASLLEGFKDAPYSQDTFDAIQDELHKQGLGPQQMGAKYRASSFSTTAALVDALSGGKGTVPGSQPVSDSELQTRSQQYIQYVAAEWKKISTTAAEEGAGSESAPAVSAVEGSAAS